MPIYDITSTGASVKQKEVFDVNSAGIASKIKEVYDASSAGIQSKVFSSELVLYDLGNEYNAVTGGFIYNIGVSTTSGYSIGGSLTRNAVYMQINCPSATSETGGGAAAITSDKIDLTPFSRCCVNVVYLNSERGTRRLRASSSKNSSFANNSAAQSSSHLAAGTHYADISNISGMYYVGVGVNTPLNISSVTLRFNKLWLE